MRQSFLPNNSGTPLQGIVVLPARAIHDLQPANNTGKVVTKLANGSGETINRCFNIKIKACDYATTSGGSPQPDNRSATSSFAALRTDNDSPATHLLPDRFRFINTFQQ